MEKARKVIISDFDDTLYVNNKISDKDIKSIDKFRKAGNLFVIATGSSYTSFLRKVGDSKLNCDYLIVNHGSTIFKEDNVMFNEVLGFNILKEIVKKYNLEDNNNYTLVKNTLGNFFSTAREGLVTPYTKSITKIHLEFTDENFKKEFAYLKVNYGEKINIYEISSNNLEIISSKASKLIAIDKILKLENINNNHVYTIGDGNSDIEMIKKYNGYAMKSSVSELKKHCIKEVGSVSELIKDLL